jgi:SWI/SNF-related matrix-associated actin-dependent regulator of chromatin subfamily A member 5
LYISLSENQLSERWKNLSDDERQPYLDQHAADVQRFRRESHAADVAAMEAAEARRKAQIVQDGESHSSRGARASADEQRRIKEERRRRQAEAAAADNSEEAMARRAAAAAKKKEAAERRAEREAQEKEVEKQHKKLDKEQARKAASRLDHLLKQSSIFAKLQGGKGALPDAEEQKADERKMASASAEGGAHHIHRPESANGDDEDEEESEQHVFLTKQPSCIKHGQLKPYQLESLNWMIHLAEKGLNGILGES